LAGGAAGWGGSSTSGQLDRLVGTGTKWLRDEFQWSKIEPSAGVFDFSYYDHYMLLAAQHGEHILPVLQDAPSWAGATSNTIPSDPSGYAGYVAAIVGRYGPHGTFWSEHPGLGAYAVRTFELWNEPYFSNGNNGDYNPARYANLVKAAGAAGHAADPSARFLLAAEMSSALTNGRWAWWVDALYQAVPDLNNYFDGVAEHPYGHDTTGFNPPVAGQPYTGYSQLRRIEAVHQQFIDHGAANKPFWLTEIGWPTCNLGASAECVTEAQQNANLNALSADLHGSWKDWVQAAFFYGFQDNGSDANNTQDNYGLLRRDGTPKPALQTFSALAAQSA